MTNAKIETLSAAAAAIATCQDAGRISTEALAPIAAAIATGITPPRVRPGHKALVITGVRAVPGSWPHYAAAIVNCEKQQLDYARLIANAKAGSERDRIRAEFLDDVITDVQEALTRALNRAIEIQTELDRQAKAAEDARQRREEEAKRQEHSARKAARDALMAAAAGQAAAPEVQTRPQGHAKRSPDSLKALIASEAKKRDNGDAAEGMFAACRFAFRLVHDDAKTGRYTPDEISLLKSAIRVEVQNVHFRASNKLAEAEREAEAWMQRGEEVMADKDRASAPRPTKTPTPTGPRPAIKSAPKPAPKAVKPAEKAEPKPETAKSKSASADEQPKPETAMGLALQKAGLGKAANG